MDDQYRRTAPARDDLAEHLRHEIDQPRGVASHLSHTVEVELVAIDPLIDDRARVEEGGELTGDLGGPEVVDLVLARDADVETSTAMGRQQQYGRRAACDFDPAGNGARRHARR